MDREKIIRIIDELIFEAQKEPIWKAENALRCLKKELLKEQEAVVRCADCRHAEVSQSGLIKCRGIFRSREWYCADGERREVNDSD